MLGWSPCYALDDALLETIAWYDDYFASLPDGKESEAAQKRSRAA
jgi:dTDP-D-glucose 4,6-dehydratase